MIKRRPTIWEFLKEECYTTLEEKDPRKPLILAGGFVQTNPNFDPELVRREYREKEGRRRRENPGTSFFLNFDPACHIHQQDNSINDQIVQLLHDRFVEVFQGQFPADDRPSAETIFTELEVALCHTPQPGFNNGEIYFWLKRLNLTENFAIQMQQALWTSVNENPVLVNFAGENYEVWFYGSGFRHY